MTTSIYPYTIGWAITNRCNLKCQHCNMDSGRADIMELTTEEAFRLIDDFSSHKIKNICFTGGEPLIRSDFFEITEYAMFRGIYVCVTTNGTLVTDEMIKKYLYAFQLVRVSVDGKNAENHDSFRNKKGSYDCAISSIKRMLDGGCNVGVVSCISKFNFNYIDEMADMISSLGIRQWFLPLLSPAGRGKNIANMALSPLEVKDFIIKINEFKSRYNLDIGIEIPYAVLLNGCAKQSLSLSYGTCAASHTQIMIFANGDVSPCFEIMLKCGNVRENTIEDIWNNNDVFVKMRNKKLIEGKCGRCKYLSACGGGCRAVPFITEGNLLGEDSVCWA